MSNEDLFGLSEKAAHALCRAHILPAMWVGVWGGDWRFIDEPLVSRGCGSPYWLPTPRKRHLWELREAGLIQEWFSPWSKPNYVTDKGLEVRAALRERMGYNA